MGILSRLYRIMRTYFAASDFDAAWQGAAGASQGTGDRSQKQDSANERQRSGADPELAGYYANLEVPYGADLETVRRARNRLMQKYHPDLHSGDPEKQRIATELVKGLNLAYDNLQERLRSPS